MSISVVMRLSPSAFWICTTVTYCTSVPVTTIMPVHPSTITPIVTARKAVVSIGRTSLKPTVNTASTVMYSASPTLQPAAT